MKARVAMLGGELTAGPRDGEGFRVRARLPVAESALPARRDDPPRPPREGTAPGDDAQAPPEAEPGSTSPVEVTVPRSLR